MKYNITDEEFDRLNWHEQRDYRWCSYCEIYYNVESNHGCKTNRLKVDNSNICVVCGKHEAKPNCQYCHECEERYL